MKIRNKKFIIFVTSLSVIIIFILYGSYKAKMFVIQDLNATAICIMDENIYVRSKSNHMFLATIPKLQAKKINRLDFHEVDIKSFDNVMQDYYNQKRSEIQGIDHFEFNKDYEINKINDYSVDKVVISDTFSEDSFLVALTEGQIMTCGDNKYGQLGNGTTTHSSTPVVLDLGHTFVDIAVMDRTAFAVDDTGALWVWGDNSVGECIVPGTDIVLEPYKLNLDEKIINVYSSQMHAFALSESGNLYSWGETVEVLGTDKITKLPMKINTLNNIVMVDTDPLTATALDAEGNVYLWGRNYNLGQSYDYNRRPIKIYASKDIKNISITPLGVAIIENNGLLRFIR